MRKDSTILTRKDFSSILKTAYIDWFDKEADINPNEIHLTNYETIEKYQDNPARITVELIETRVAVETYTAGRLTHYTPRLHIVVSYTMGSEAFAVITITEKEWEDEICEELARDLENELERRFSPRDPEE